MRCLVGAESFSPTGANAALLHRMNVKFFHISRFSSLSPGKFRIAFQKWATSASFHILSISLRSTNYLTPYSLAIHCATKWTTNNETKTVQGREYTPVLMVKATCCSEMKASFRPLLGNGFQWRTFHFRWVPELSPCLSNSNFWITN